jgi:hypothetical protein
MITNSSSNKNFNFSEKTSTFFRKDTLSNFFLLNSDNELNKPTYLTKLNTNKKNNLFWTKTIRQNTVNKNEHNYIYKPDSLVNLKSFFECLFLRKSKSFNKGRYSRNRQVYRTGVYMCFYINVIALYMLWFYFYKFKFKFTYLWWLFILLPFSFINGRALKYNLYFPKEFLLHLNNYLNWFMFFFKK